MADNINYVTTAVIRGCQEKNVETTETMAAFVARARVLEAPELFHANASMTEGDVNELVKVCAAHDQPTHASPTLRVAAARALHSLPATALRAASPPPEYPHNSTRICNGRARS